MTLPPDATASASPPLTEGDFDFAAHRRHAVDAKSYLDARFGADGRMRDFSYQFETRTLRALGFSSLHQLDVAIAGYDDDAVSRIIHGGRQGQLSETRRCPHCGPWTVVSAPSPLVEARRRLVSSIRDKGT
jgi:hypothetical protein